MAIAMRNAYMGPRKFNKLNINFHKLRSSGWSDDAAIVEACRTVGIEPPTQFEGVNIIVDYELAELDQD